MFQIRNLALKEDLTSNIQFYGLGSSKTFRDESSIKSKNEGNRIQFKI